MSPIKYLMNKINSLMIILVLFYIFVICICCISKRIIHTENEVMSNKCWESAHKEFVIYYDDVLYYYNLCMSKLIHHNNTERG